MGLFGDSSGDETQIKVTLDAVKAIEQAEQLQAKIDKLGEAGETNSKKVELLQRALDEVRKKAEDAGTSGFTPLQAKIITASEAMQAGAIVGKVLVNVLSALPSAIIKLADAGAMLGDLENGFKALGGSTVTIDEASARINGILPNIDLLRIANKAMVAGIPEINKNFADIADYGKKVGDSLGISATQGIEQLTQALVSGRAVALKQMGIIIDSDKAYEDYAKRLGITGRELSDLEKKTAITSQALETMRERLGKLPSGSADVQDGIEGIQAKLTNLIGETGKAVNNNDDLAEALQKLGGVIDDIDVEQLASDVATLTAKFVDLAGSGLSVAVEGLQDFNKWLATVKALGDDTSPVVGHLQTGFTRLGQLATKVFGGAYDEASGLLGAVVGWDKAQAKVNKQLEETAKGQDKVNDLKEEYELLLKDQQQLHEEELKRLKEEQDKRDKINKGIEAGKKLKEEEERITKQLAKANKDAFEGLQSDINQMLRENSLDKLQDQLKKAFELKDLTQVGTLRESIREQVYQGIVEGYEKAGGKVDSNSEPFLKQKAELETDDIVTSTKEGIEKGVKEGFLQSELPNYLSEMITNAITTGFSDGFNEDFLKSAGNTLSSVFAQEFQNSFQKMFSSEAGGGFGANWQGALTNLGISYGISSLTANATDNKKDTGGGIASGAILGASYGSTFGPWGTAIGAVVGAGAGYVVGQSGPSTNSDTKNRHETINFIEGLIDNKHLSFLQEQGNIIEGMNQRFNTQGTGGGLWDDIVRGSSDAFFNFTSGGVDQFVGAGDMAGNAIQGERYDPIQGQIAGPDWANQYWDQFGQQGGESFQALGSAFSEMAGQMGPAMEQVGVIIAENLGGNLDNARMLLQTLGIGAEDLEQSFMNIGLSGEESWHTVETYMQSIGDLTGEGLIGIGDLQGAMDQFTASGGRGQEALIALRNVGIEAMQAGATSMEGLRTHLISLGTLTSSQIDALMGGLAQRGITSLEGLRDASDRALGGVTADAESLGFIFDDSVAEGIKDSAKEIEKLDKALRELPDTTEKSVVLKVRTEYSGDDAKALYNDLRSNVGVARE